MLACLVVGRERRALAWRRTATIVGCAGLVTFVALVAFTPADASWVVHGGFGAIAVVNVALIYSAIVPGARPVGLLALTPLVAIGRVSYGLYLYHWPVFVWLDESRTGLDRARCSGSASRSPRSSPSSRITCSSPRSGTGGLSYAGRTSPV